MIGRCDSCGAQEVGRLTIRLCGTHRKAVTEALREAGVMFVWADEPNRWWAGGNPWPP